MFDDVSNQIVGEERKRSLRWQGERNLLVKIIRNCPVMPDPNNRSRLGHGDPFIYQQLQCHSSAI